MFKKKKKDEDLEKNEEMNPEEVGALFRFQTTLSQIL